MGAPAPPLPVARDLTGRRLGRYEVLTQLASGGMATVYVARAQGVAGFERLVAVKVLHPHLAHDAEFISMFLDEARLAARIRHPNVVATLDISDTQGDGFFLVMELVEGDHFGNLLRETSRAGALLPIPVAARVVVDALEGLGAAHTLKDDDGRPLGIVHRDVSPHNILVGADGVARITDFGVARAEVRLSSTRDGQFKGKLSYMAPEQASSGGGDQRSDLFSMGIVLWESITGRRLFRADTNGELLHKLLHEPLVPPSTYVPEAAAFDAVCARALARSPDERFATADAFVEAVEAAAASCGGLASPRVVGRHVREMLGATIEARAVAVRAAADALGRSDLRPGTLPRPEGGSQPSGVGRSASAMTPSAVRTATSEDATMGALPSNVGTLAPTPPRRRVAWWIGAIVVALIGIAGAAAMIRGADAPTSPARVGDAPERVAAPAVEVEVPPTPPPAVPSTDDRPDGPSGVAADARGPEGTAAVAEGGTPAVTSDVPAPTSPAPSDARRVRSGRPDRRATPRVDDGDTEDELLLNPYRR